MSDDIMIAELDGYLKLLEKKYHDYKLVVNFVKSVVDKLGESIPYPTIGVCNDTASCFIPICDIGQTLISQDLKIDVKELNERHLLLKYHHRCEDLIKWFPQLNRKYYYIRMSAHPYIFSDSKLKADERIKLLNEVAKECCIEEHFIMRTHLNGSYISIDFIEKLG